MDLILVIENPRNWDFHIPGVTVVAARDYLTEPRWASETRLNVFNLCRTYSYQTVGYYVSLLAAARGHRPLPSVSTIQDMRTAPILRIVSDDLLEEIEKDLEPLQADHFSLSIYFGRNVARRYDRLSQALFNHFPAPFLRAEFERADGEWRLESIRPVGSSEIPVSHREFIQERAKRYFARPERPRKTDYRYELAILVDPEETEPPSDEVALRRFSRAAEKLGMRPTLITKDEYGRIPEFDALFIRATTAVNHHTYRFSRRALAEGMVVIDDPESIIRCTNKVYQAELFSRNRIPHPRTVVVHRENVWRIREELGFPCVLKKPDSSFSLGVEKIANERALAEPLEAYFVRSELAVAQEFVPSDFDWRIGVLDGKALYACRYHMAPGHWQVVKSGNHGRRRWGRVDTLLVEDAPPKAVQLAERCAALVGDGLYGVDIKEVKGRFLVIEGNDNPSIEGGEEDRLLKHHLYDQVMGSIYRRLEHKGRSEPAS
jgi:glutathione synthase/RimK-type ligase-like ATP-grasp enzyme